MKEKLSSLFYVIIGILMIACAIHFFLLPANMSLGGATGMALLLRKFIPISTGVLLIFINIFLFVLGFITIGNEFGTKTVIASLLLSANVWLFENFIPINEPLIEDAFLQLVVAVLLYGVGVGLVLNQNTSTGGSDIFAMILKKYLGMDLGAGCLMTDFIITLFSGFSYGTENALFSLVGVVINGVVIDFTINGINMSRYCIINTEKPDELCKFLVGLERSANVYKATGAFTGVERAVVHTVLSRRDFVSLRNFLVENDKDAFMVVTNTSSIFGRNWRKLSE